MNQTVFHEELKQMRFEEAYDGFQKKRLAQEEAASLLGVCSRSFRRYIHRWERQTFSWLVSTRAQRLSQL